MKKKVVIIENNILATNTIRGKLSSTLISEGYDVTILTTGTEDELALARSKGFKVIDVKGSNRHPGDIATYLKNLRNAIRNIGPDVVLTFTIRPAIWGNMVTRQLGIPTITNITGIGPLFASDKFIYKAIRFIYRFVLNKTAKVFFQNYDDMELFIKKKFVTPDRAERIPGSGIDYEYFKPLPRKNVQQFNFLFIGRLIKDKGILEYVEAARVLKTEFPTINFQILGPFWSQNLNDNIITEKDVEGWVNERIIDYKGAAIDVREYIAEADCVVLPSYREGTSNVLLEASSMAKPVIASNTTGCKEIVAHGETGYLVMVKDAADLTDKMRQMYNLSPQERTNMGTMGREKVIKEFDKQIVIDAYLRAIDQLIR